MTKSWLTPLPGSTPESREKFPINYKNYPESTYSCYTCLGNFSFRGGAREGYFVFFIGGGVVVGRFLAL